MEKRYDFTKAEKQMQELWEREHTYRFDKNAGGELYSIDTPPPTVSGSLHIGHLFSYAQAEMIARFRRMQGYNVFYPFGFDDNGLPTERLVEREESIRGNSVPRGEFIERCEKTSAKYENEFKELWKSFAVSADWDSEYRTISPEVRKLSQKLFIELAKSGKAYVKESPVLWCTECQTSIAQAELDTSDTESAYNYIPFAVDGDELIVATTRPELLYGCVCLFVNPEDERYSRYIGKQASVPLYSYEIPILTDDKAAIDKGTGVVMCATFGDSTDAEWQAQYNLPYRRVILPDGRIAEDVPFIAGLSVHEAREKIITLLKEHDLLKKTEAITHQIGVHERCGTEIEITPSRQWYIEILSARDEFLKAADDISWYPPAMKKRYTAWVENLKWDWCVSRQRYFGVPIPVWYCEACGKPAFASSEQLPINPLETRYDGICECGCKNFAPESAVLDTWATSSITPMINERLGLPLSPMSMRTHAHEIIRTWTFYSIVRSLYHKGHIPWKELMICGFVLAKKGEKIGKSKNNSELDPKTLIAAHSADALRYWSSGAKLGTDTFFNSDELAPAKRFITKLWNASRFAVSLLEDFIPGDSPALMPADKWIIERVRETTATASSLLYKYETGAARHEIDALFWNDFCGNYIEIVKGRLYEPEIHGESERESAQYTLYYCLLNILKLYSIYVPHITEYIYRQFFRQYEKTPSLHLTLWEKPLHIDESLIRFGEKLKETVFEARRYKSERNLSMRAEMDRLEIKADPDMLEWLRLNEKDLMACTNAKEIFYIIE